MIAYMYVNFMKNVLREIIQKWISWKKGIEIISKEDIEMRIKHFFSGKLFHH